MESLNNQASSEINTPMGQFSIQKLYVKHLLFDISNAPQLFKKKEQPKIEFQLEIKTEELPEKNHYEVTLGIKAQAKLEEEKLFEVTLNQAGIFLIENYTSDQLDQLLNNYCPSILFPYAREIISDTALRGGLMPIILAPINFDAIYVQKKQHEKDQAQRTDDSPTTVVSEVIQ